MFYSEAILNVDNHIMHKHVQRKCLTRGSSFCCIVTKRNSIELRELCGHALCELEDKK